jgi:aminoglycoside phosphotransferase (APT) family kinase protein
VLDLADVAPYLIDRRLISARAVVDGRLRVADVSRLNRVFLVTAEGERCFVLKTGPAGDTGVAREAAVLERLRSVDASRKVALSLPKVVGYDRAEGALILEAEPGARDLARHHTRGRFSRALAREAGRALAILHGIAPAALSDLKNPEAPTWSSRVHEPDLESMRTLSAAAVDLTRIIQSVDDLCVALDEVASSWCAESVIHGDVRWDNFLALRDHSSDRWERLLLIDWELAAPGDPAEDVGSFLGEYLRTWRHSIPVSDLRERHPAPEHARYPLRRMQPALRAFWDGYTSYRAGSAAELSPMLRRATRFAAVRLLTAALEEAQMLTEVRASVVDAVQLSRAILRRPDETAAHLLGLRASWAAT